jgi:hypothetical protein
MRLIADDAPWTVLEASAPALQDDEPQEAPAEEVAAAEEEEVEVVEEEVVDDVVVPPPEALAAASPTAPAKAAVSRTASPPVKACPAFPRAPAKAAPPPADQQLADVAWLEPTPLAHLQYPETPIERLRQLGDASVTYFERKEQQLLATHLRQWESPSAPPESLTPVFNALHMDQESRLQFLLLLRTSEEGKAEACNIMAHLLRNRTSIRSVSGYVSSSIHESRNWVDRPPYTHVDFEVWMARRTSGGKKGGGKKGLTDAPRGNVPPHVPHVPRTGGKGPCPAHPGMPPVDVRLQAPRGLPETFAPQGAEGGDLWAAYDPHAAWWGQGSGSGWGGGWGSGWGGGGWGGGGWGGW